jgi:hypothetical protein
MLDILQSKYEGTADISQSSDEKECTNQSKNDDAQSDYQPSPQGKCKRSVSLEDRETALQFWLNKGGKKYSLSMVVKNFTS